LRCQTRVDLGPVPRCNKPPAPSNLPHAVSQARRRPLWCWSPCSVVSCLFTVPLLINAALYPGPGIINLLHCFEQSIIPLSHFSVTEALQAIQGFPEDGVASCTGHTLAGKSRTLPHTLKFPVLSPRLPYRSTSSRTISFPSLSFTPTPDRPLASTEEGARYAKAEAGPSNYMYSPLTPCPVAVSPEEENNTGMGTQAYEIEYVLTIPSSL
jgi:hypothetical protein